MGNARCRKKVCKCYVALITKVLMTLYWVYVRMDRYTFPNYTIIDKWVKKRKHVYKRLRCTLHIIYL